MGRSASCSCMQHLGLSTRWTEEGNGCDWWPLIVVVVAVSCGCCCWWVAAQSLYIFGVARFCTMPGPFDPVDSGVGGCPWCRPIAAAIVVVRGCGLQWLAAWSLHSVSVARFCATWGLPWLQGVSQGGRVPLRHSGRWHTFMLLRRRWVVCRCLRHAAVTRVSTTLGPWGLLAMWAGI